MKTPLLEELHQVLFGEVLERLPTFCLKRWQSLHETSTRVLLSDSGVHPLTFSELLDYGLSLDQLLKIKLGYGWTKGSVCLLTFILFGSRFCGCVKRLPPRLEGSPSSSRGFVSGCRGEWHAPPIYA